ncbi:MAG: SIR2 family protein [Eubacteriales bacterium]
MRINQMIDKIKEANVENKLVVFIGAGVSSNSGYKPWQELIREMDKKIKYSEDPSDKRYSNDELLRIPQYFCQSDPEAYKETIEDNYSFLPEKTNKIIDKILELKPHHIITTNFDTLIEFSIRETGRKIIESRTQNHYAFIRKDQDLISVSQNNLLIKMHGDINEFDSIVLKEDDYLNYSSSHILIETFIKALLIDHTFLFVGYGVNDYNLKLIMNWVDNVVLNYKMDKDIRRPHFFINPDIKPLSKFDKKYFETKNIYVIDAASLPAAVKNLKAEEMSSELGKNVLRTVRYIIRGNPTSNMVSYVCKKLEFFSNLDRIIFEDILDVLDGDSLSYKLIDGVLYCSRDTVKYSEAMAVVINVCEKGLGDSEADFIKEILIKAGVIKIVIAGTSKSTEIILEDKKGKDETLFNAIVERDFETIHEKIKSGTVDKLYLAYLKMFVGDPGSKKTLMEIESSIAEENYAKQVIFAHNASQFIINIALPKKIVDVLSSDEKRYITPLCDLAFEFTQLYAAWAISSMEIMQKYSAFNEEDMQWFDVKDDSFSILRSRIIDTVKYFISNGVYTFGCLTGDFNISRYLHLLGAYIDTMLFFESPHCQREKCDAFRLNKEDMLIITSYIEPDVFKFMLKKNNVEKLDLSKECIDYLLLVLKNVIKERARRIIKGEEDNPYLVRVTKAANVLLNLCDLGEQEQDVIEDIAEKMPDVILNKNA